MCYRIAAVHLFHKGGGHVPLQAQGRWIKQRTTPLSYVADLPRGFAFYYLEKVMVDGTSVGIAT